MIRILVATNDIVLERMLTVTLTINGFAIVTTKNLREAQSIIEIGKIDIFILDQGLEAQKLPEFLDAFARKKVLTSLLLIGEKLEDWETLSKPVEFPALKFKINELYRKKRSLSEKFIWFGDLKIDVGRKLVTFKEGVVKLGMVELAILIMLAKKTGKIVGREAIKSDLESQGLLFNSVFQHHIWELKNKLKVLAGDKYKIKLVVGQGFKLTS